MGELQKILIEKRNKLKLSLREAGKLIGISHSYLSTLEKGIDPRTGTPVKPTPETLKLISEAYKINYDTLMKAAGYLDTDIRNPADEITDAVSDDPELAEFWNDLKQREDLKLLFKQTRNLSPKAIKQVMRIIKAIEDEEEGG